KIVGIQRSRIQWIGILPVRIAKIVADDAGPERRVGNDALEEGLVGDEDSPEVSRVRRVLPDEAIDVDDALPRQAPPHRPAMRAISEWEATPPLDLNMPAPK